MAESILKHHHTRVAYVMLTPSSGGAFEVTCGGRLLHSKRATRRDPSLRLVLAGIQAIADGTFDADDPA